MKKSLLALAVLGAFAGVASAQTQVTLYGQVEAVGNFGRRTETTTNTTTTTRATGVVTQGTNAVSTVNPALEINDGATSGLQSSRWGLKGTEDLGGGLKAFFNVENGFNVDDGTANQGGALFGRRAVVGLEGSFGSVAVGRQKNPAYQNIFENSDVQDDSGAAIDPAARIINPNRRSNNSVRYDSPSFSGFGFSALYSAPEAKANSVTVTPGVNTVTANTQTNPGYSLSGVYANGPLFVGLGYDRRDAGTDATTVNAAGVVTGLSNTATKTTLWTGGVSYDFKVVKPYFNYTRTTTDASGVTSPTVVTPTNAVLKAWALGLSAPVGAGLLFGQYADGKTTATANTFNSGVLGNFTNIDQRQKGFSLGYNYDLSKRTTVWTAYGQYKSDTVASTIDPVNQTDVSTQVRDRVLSVGLRHKF
jgi:predicted porin